MDVMGEKLGRAHKSISQRVDRDDSPFLWSSESIQLC
jgi:hypothetical protein